jgi:hypothetical protein
MGSCSALWSDGGATLARTANKAPQAIRPIAFTSSGAREPMNNETGGWSELRRRALTRLFGAVVIAGLVPFSTPVSSAEPDYAAERAEMVRVIEHYAREPGSAVAGGGLAPGVLQVMGIVPRQEFVPDDLRGDAI